MAFRLLVLLLLLSPSLAWGQDDEAEDEPLGLPSTAAPDAELKEEFTAEEFFEGPTWDPKSQKLYFTAFGKDTRILRLDADGKAAEWMAGTQGINGTWLGKDGRLLCAQGQAKAIVSIEISAEGPGDVKQLALDPAMNLPNDICQTPNGNIYFTAPDFNEQKTSAVYLLRPEGKPEKIIDDMKLCNGVIASLEGTTLYVSDSADKFWKRYPIKPDGTTGPGEIFFAPETENRNELDGMSIDEQGNLYLTGLGGLWVVDPSGKPLGHVPVPEFLSNVTFGGPEGNTLYLTCQSKVYSLAMRTRGGQFATPKPASRASDEE